MSRSTDAPSRASRFDDSALTPAERASRRRFAVPTSWRSAHAAGKRPRSPSPSPPERPRRLRRRKQDKIKSVEECARLTATVVALVRGGEACETLCQRALDDDADFLRALTADVIRACAEIEDDFGVQFLLENRRDWCAREVREAFESSVESGAWRVVEAFLESAPETCALAPRHYLEVLNRGHVVFAMRMLERCVEVPILAADRLVEAVMRCHKAPNTPEKELAVVAYVNGLLEGGVGEHLLADTEDEEEDLEAADERRMRAYDDAVEFIYGGEEYDVE